MRRQTLTVVLAGVVSLWVATSAWAQEVPPPNEAVTSPDVEAFQQPALAINPVDPSQMAVAYQEGVGHGDCYVATSRDGGRSWSGRALVGPRGPFPLPPDFTECFDPNIAYGPGGVLHYTFEPRNPEAFLLSRRVLITTSTDAGRSFSQPKLVDPDGVGAGFERACSTCLDFTDLFSDLSVDPRSGRVYVSWIRNCKSPSPECVDSPIKVVVASSDDRGQTFRAPTQANQPVAQPQPARQVGAVGPDGVFYLSFIDGGFDPSGQTNKPIFATSSSDGARTFSTPVRMATYQGCESCSDALRFNPESNRFPFYSLAAGTVPGEVYAALWDGRDGRYRIVFTKSSDGGRTWSEERVIGIPRGGETHEQHRPRVTATPDGRVHVVYYDYDAAANLERVYLTVSSDRGATFSAPRQLTGVPSDSRVGPPGSDQHANFGQQLGIASVGNSVFGAWTDTRRGDPVNAKQDVFLAGAQGERVIHPAKLQIKRARIVGRDRRLSVLAPITGRASGAVRVELFAAQRRFAFTERVDPDARRVRFSRRIPAQQAKLGTGIVTLTYPGDEDTRPQVVRLRAASRKADLKLDRPRLDDGRLTAEGTVNPRARGVVRLQLQYVVDGATKTHKLRARIRNGRWRFDERLADDVREEIARRTGTVQSYTLFTGYLPQRIGGEMQSFKVLGIP